MQKYSQQILSLDKCLSVPRFPRLPNPNPNSTLHESISCIYLPYCVYLLMPNDFEQKENATLHFCIIRVRTGSATTNTAKFRQTRFLELKVLNVFSELDFETSLLLTQLTELLTLQTNKQKM